VVGLLLFGRTNVTRYRLPNHCLSPNPRILAADINEFARRFPALAGKAKSSAAGRADNPIGIVGIALSHFIAQSRETGEQGSERIGREVKPEQEMGAGF
jgi:hypothetical protein